nr:DUF6273 domain-containing protein [Clostridiales bacterium]
MVIKCKMCGGDVRFNPGDTIGICDHCGCSSTIPRVDEEQKLNRYNRANHFRRQNEFDKAIAAYERILEEDDTDAEAHWGAVLSRYGIEYVEDPGSGRRIPTCHRVQVASILADGDYLAAIRNAPDAQSRALYEEQAKEIAEIQKRILQISQNEKPYDVFICYKEADENGNRTKDSTIAQEIYYELTEQGYKVFFSRITLEDKLGQEYEPYIFAALNSARVMLVIGTKPEYFESVWVKNEWSRYLALVKEDRKRLLIPCYRDMDAYELPEELGNLQSQDMSRIGFIQDLIRGIRKTIDAGKSMEEPGAREAGGFTPTGGGNIQALLERAYLSLEDEEFDKADELCEAALNLDARNASAYLGKLMADLKVTHPEKLEQEEEPFDSNPQYKKVMRFADEELKAALQEYNETIRARNNSAREAEQADREFAEAIRAYCTADQVIQSETQKMQKISQAIGDTKAKLERLDMELSQAGGLFSLSRRKELEQKIDRQTRRLDDLKQKQADIQSAIRDAYARIPKKPDWQEKAYRTAGIYYENHLIKKAAAEYVLIADYRDVPEIIRNDTRLEEAVNALLPARGEMVAQEVKKSGELFRQAEQEANVIVGLHKTQDWIQRLTTVGNVVEFGSYYRDNNRDKDPIEWIVIAASENSVQLVARYGIETRRFQGDWCTAEWEKSSLRQWLNEEWFQDVFSDEEQKAVEITTVDNGPDQGVPGWHGVNGVTTQDRVFLLSFAEVSRLLAAEEKICRATEYAKGRGAFVRRGDLGIWWLRSPGRNGNNEAYINTDGTCHEYDAMNAGVMVRPSIRIRLDRLK